MEETKTTKTDPLLIAKFFNLPANTDPAIIRVANDLKKQEAKNHFLTKFIEKNGIPRWDKIFYSVKNTNSTGNKGTATFTDSSGQGIFFIPLQSTNSSSVLSYITCYKHNDSTYTYRNYNKDSLDNIKPANDSSRKNLFNAQLLFGYFEKKINNKDSIQIKSPYNAYIKNANIQLTPPKPGGRTNDGPDPCRVIWNFIITYLTSLPSTIRTTSDVSVYSVELTVTVDCFGGSGGTSGSGGTGTTAVGGTSGTSTYSGSESSGTYTTSYYWYDYGTGWPYTNNTTTNNNDPNYNPTWYQWWTGGGYNTTGGTGYSATVQNLTNTLSLQPNQSDWLSQNSNRADEIYYYLNSGAQPLDIAKQIATDHLNRLMTDTDYLAFVQGHFISSPIIMAWWENDVWLSNPKNFNLDVSPDENNQYDELTPAEKALVNRYPQQANIIWMSKKIAEDETIKRRGTNGLNDKSDAFRHAFFQALNTVRIGASLTKQFSDAHESEVPSQLIMEKQMDLFNNYIGIDFGQFLSPIFWTVNDISDNIYRKLANGELKYLKPTLPPPFFPNGQPNPNGDPDFYGTGGINNPRTATHGIYSATQIIPTNQ